jgi:hypothetical protein
MKYAGAVGLGIDLVDRLAQRQPTGETAVGLDREGDYDR